MKKRTIIETVGVLVRLSLVMAFAALAACGDETGCGDAPESDAATAPRLETFRFVDQLRGDPWTLVFAASFVDSDSDLRPGTAEFHLNDSTEPSGSFELDSVFRQSAVPTDADRGELAITLRLVNPVSDGTELQVGMRLVDVSGQPSNCRAVDIEFSVARVAHAAQRIGERLLATLWPTTGDPA